MAAEDNGEAVAEPEQVVDPLRDREGRFAARAQKIVEEHESAAPATAEPQQETAEPQAETPDAGEVAAATVVEGPSEAAWAAAFAAGVDEEVLAGATSDREVMLLIRAAKKFQAPRAEQPAPAVEQVKPEPEFKFEWPDDEIPATDPVRRQVEKLHEYYKQREAASKRTLDAVSGWAAEKYDQEQKQKLEAQAKEQQAEIVRQQEYDRVCDELGIPELGQTAKLQPEVSPEWWKRNAEYKTYRNMIELGFDPDYVKQSIAHKFGHKPKQQSVSQVVREQAQTRLGGGNARPAPAKLDREQRWAEMQKTL